LVCIAKKGAVVGKHDVMMKDRIYLTYDDNELAGESCMVGVMREQY